ncbi:MAG: cytidine/deoxycytidylate deaminase family protein [Candidatus Nanoarchaeia archaeon]|nr:cytidine/deoxycytidylate deaminase family protein [Candidatus Nanoarchaeia archaeon]MDD5239435.1 cytidine/deoxycytidylate deaminase family protein [Candidatus Nanoarchaeia archaeon]
MDDNKNSSEHKRPDWDEYFLQILEAVSKRATCGRGRSGAVIVKNKHILTTGYVGAPVGLPHCDEVGHLFRKAVHTDGTTKDHCVRTTHAEANAIAQSAKFGIPIEGATLYSTMFPCLDCTKLLINSGIKRVVAMNDYQASQDSKDFLSQANVEFKILTPEPKRYEEK